VPETPQDAYERGREAGKIDRRLDEHTERLDRINGAMSDVANELQQLRMAVQSLGADAKNERANVITTAAAVKETAVTTASALKDAEEARRDKSEQTWSPLARIGAGLGIVATVVGLYLAFRNGGG
jgi:methyl-accepting chemotaxis protein